MNNIAQRAAPGFYHPGCGTTVSNQGWGTRHPGAPCGLIVRRFLLLHLLHPPQPGQLIRAQRLLGTPTRHATGRPSPLLSAGGPLPARRLHTLHPPRFGGIHPSDTRLSFSWCARPTHPAMTAPRFRHGRVAAHELSSRIPTYRIMRSTTASGSANTSTVFRVR